MRCSTAQNIIDIWNLLLQTMEVDRKTLFVALSAYVMWGCFPLFFILLKGSPVLEILGYRIIWSAVFLLIAAKILKRFGEVKRSLMCREILITSFVSAVLLACNWAVFIYAVDSRQVLAASLGHLLTPIVAVILGLLFFNERPSALQWVAVAIVGLALSIPLVTSGTISWITFFQTATFSAYGLMHKRKKTDGFLGMMVETLTMAPVGIGLLIVVEYNGLTTFDLSAPIGWLLILSGAVTVGPLVAFSVAARKMPLGMLGFFTSIIPSFQFFIAIFVLGEALSTSNAVVYGMCWCALFLYLTSLWAQARKATIIAAK